MTYQLLHTVLVEKLKSTAGSTTRKRINYNFHQPGDLVQRFLNAVEPGSYIRPHKHENPDKTETFIVLEGTIKFFVFDEQGSVTACYKLGKNSDNLGIDVLPRTWHTFAVIDNTAVVFEVKEGPYIQEQDKTFAGFAPAEGSTGVHSYLRMLEEYPAED